MRALLTKFWCACPSASLRVAVCSRIVFSIEYVPACYIRATTLSCSRSATEYCYQHYILQHALQPGKQLDVKEVHPTKVVADPEHDSWTHSSASKDLHHRSSRRTACYPPRPLSDLPDGRWCEGYALAHGDGVVDSTPPTPPEACTPPDPEWLTEMSNELHERRQVINLRNHEDGAGVHRQEHDVPVGQLPDEHNSITPWQRELECPPPRRVRRAACMAVRVRSRRLRWSVWCAYMHTICKP